LTKYVNFDILRDICHVVARYLLVATTQIHFKSCF